MKILIVSYHFPPFNTIGAVRVGKFAKFLMDKNHEVKILTAGNQLYPTTLPQEIDEENIIRTNWLNINFIPELLFGGKKKVVSSGYSAKSSLTKKLGNLYRNIFHFPDEAIGWYPFAVLGGKKILKNWKPDLIFASALPPTSLLIGNRLSKKAGIKWVAELRDLWADSARYPFSEQRRYFDNLLEKYILSQADSIVTVTDHWGDILKAKYSCEVCVSKNGFDPKDFEAVGNIKIAPANILKIVYTGVIYPKFQNIEPFFIALSEMGDDAKCIQFEIYTRYMDIVDSLANKYKLSNIVYGMGRVSYRDSLRAQMQADVLLLLGWGDSNQPEEFGNIPAKLFEYFGARRPILSIGSERDIVSKIIKGRNAGLASCDPETIKQQLKIWIDTKSNLGYIPSLPFSIQTGMTRNEQFEILESFLKENYST